MDIEMWTDKLIPKSITGQLLTIIITAITALQIVYIVVNYIDDLDDDDDYTLNHIAEMADILPHVAPDKYTQMIELAGFDYLSYVYSSAPLAGQPDNQDLIKIQNDLIDRTGLLIDQIKVSEIYKLDPRFIIKDDGHGDHQETKKNLVSVQVDDTGWLNVAMNIHDNDFGYYSPFNLTVSVSLIVIVVSIFVLLKVTRPLDQLTNSIEKFSDDFKVTIVKEEGSHDLKRAIRSFNKMQKGVASHIELRIKTLTALSHDIRTPLTSLRLKAELMPEGSDKEGIISSVNKMENLTRSVIDFLKGSNDLIHKKPTDLKMLIETECLELKELGNPVSINKTVDLTVNCDPEAISRALNNLIDNALKYGNNANISLSLENDMAQIIVDDSGGGIDEDKLTDVLEPFERIDKARHDQKGGFGLGLSIVNDIAKAHNGSIQLKNRNNGGLRAILEIAIK